MTFLLSLFLRCSLISKKKNYNKPIDKLLVTEMLISGDTEKSRRNAYIVLSVKGRIACIFVSFFCSSIAGLSTDVEGSHFAHRWSRQTCLQCVSRVTLIKYFHAKEIKVLNPSVKKFLIGCGEFTEL